MQKILYIFLAVVVLSLLACNESKAQQELNEEFLEQLRAMELEDILNTKITVASQVPLSMREAPGIVTLITRQDIINSGARDLIDVFSLLVPGFTFLQSEFGPISIGVRGLWGFEGKVLMLIDGIEVNEGGFSSVIFGNHYNTENIERIEIIRGPGSVMYGKYAALAVINIVTRNFNTINGAYAGFQYSRMFDDYSHLNGVFGYGDVEGDFMYSITGYAGSGKLSDRNYIPYFSDRVQNSSAITFDPFHFNINAGYEGYDLRAIIEQYNQEYDVALKFMSALVKLEKTYPITNGTDLSFTISNKWQRPWKIKDSGTVLLDGVYVDTTYANNKTLNDITFSARVENEITNDIHILSGVEYNYMSVKTRKTPGYIEYPPDSSGSINSFSIFAQGIYHPRFGNFVLGGRLEKNENYGTSFVPRVAFTKIIGDFHLKAMYSKTYRVPTGRAIFSDLEPERGTDWELELGYQLAENHYMSINIYNYSFDDLIVMRSKEELSEPNYQNSEDKYASHGMEVEYRKAGKDVSLGVNFAFSRVKQISLENYKVPGMDGEILGFPSFTLNSYAAFCISDHLSISPSFSFYGTRYGYINGKIVVVNGLTKIEHTLKEFDPVFLFNLNFRTNDLFLDGLDVDLGIKNLLNVEYEYIQPFQSLSAPLPAPSAALVLRMVYNADL